MESRITFRKQRKYDGLARYAPSYVVNRCGEEIARIQNEDGNSFDYAGGLWFWYGDGVNTAGNAKPLAECKADIRAHFAPPSK